MVSRAKLPCQMFDPQRGPFDPSTPEPEGPRRPGKTREDRMHVDRRPRVQAARDRYAAARA